MSSSLHKHSFVTAIMAMLPIWVIAFLTALALCECSTDNANTPRRKAYPRIDTHDSTFTLISNCPIHFEISDIAIISLDSINNDNHWINIYYKPYNATIYCTFTPVDKHTIENVIDNRTERMALNSGDHSSELIELTNANGFKSQILITEQSKITPVQFLSTNENNWVVSGALYFNNSSNSPDSIRPIINILKRDIIHAMKTIDSNENS